VSYPKSKPDCEIEEYELERRPVLESANDGTRNVVVARKTLSSGTSIERDEESREWAERRRQANWVGS
jgi:hypothetical protein